MSKNGRLGFKIYQNLRSGVYGYFKISVLTSMSQSIVFSAKLTTEQISLAVVSLGFLHKNEVSVHLATHLAMKYFRYWNLRKERSTLNEKQDIF